MKSVIEVLLRIALVLAYGEATYYIGWNNGYDNRESSCKVELTLAKQGYEIRREQ